jgi:aminopeptidase N
MLAHDTDPFNRFEAGRALARDILHAMVLEGATPGPDYLNALRTMVSDEALDPAFRALALHIPGQDDLASSLYAAGHVPDPDAIQAARTTALRLIAEALRPQLQDVANAMQTPGPYSPDARDAGRRALKVQAVSLLARADEGAKAAELFARADNMTEQLGAWGALLAIGKGQEEGAQFYRQWAQDRLVVDKWFSAQVMYAAPKAAAGLVQQLTQHPDFEWKNPNRFRSVIGALGANPAGFHTSDGAGYKLVADWLIRLDGVNPQSAARLSTLFETWRRYDASRQALIRAELQRIRSQDNLSRDMGEMVGRMLG